MHIYQPYLVSTTSYLLAEDNTNPSLSFNHSCSAEWLIHVQDAHCQLEEEIADEEGGGNRELELEAIEN